MPWNLTKVATIAAGQSLSDAQDLGDQRLFGIEVPTGWTAAAITFQTMLDGVNWIDLYDSSGPVSVPISPGRLTLVDPSTFFGLRTLRLRSGAPGSAVNQVGARAINLVTVPRA